MSTVQIKQVIEDKDLKDVVDLANEIWHEYFPFILSDEQIDYMVDRFQSYDAMKDQMQSG